MLDFSGPVCSASPDGSGAFAACGKGGFINQAYGDSAGANVTYQASPGSPTSMYFWADSYSGLENVAYGDVGNTPTILIVPTPGNTVTLSGFYIGSWPNVDRFSQVTVLDLAGGSPLVSAGSITILGAASTIFSINATSSAGFSIAFGPDGYNVGIDNVDFTTLAVPEPASMALPLAGLAVVGAAGRASRT